MPSPRIFDYPIDALSEKVVEATRDFEFDTFVIGIQRGGDYSREVHEDAYRKVKIDLGSRLLEIWPERQVDFEKPELRVDLRTTQDDVEVIAHATPLFIGGRYLKHSREIPACRWMHLRCKGRGCRDCNFTGNLCGPSIQELAEPTVLAATGGEATFFHGAGREDVDVRMLGTGRPFVIEVRASKRRRPDLAELTRRINAAADGYAAVLNLALTTRKGMVEAKSAVAEKTYRAYLRFAGAVPDDLEERLNSLRGAEIAQLSPIRVMKRRGVDTVRRKKVLDTSLIGTEGDTYIWEVRASSGTYIKELISGDEGRTEPSVASVVGVPCECEVLDVMGIHWTAPWEGADRPVDEK